MELLENLTFALLLAGLAPISARFFAKGERRVARLRALERIEREPRYFVGAKVAALYVEGKEEPLIEDAVITSMTVGRIELETATDVVPMTNIEFERAHAIMRK